MPRPKPLRKPDFGGYATKANLRCDDGRTIIPHAFKHQHGVRVPLVWEHMRDGPDNVLGHAILEDRADGVYARCWFNNTPTAQAAKETVAHGDITQLSIYANKLKEIGKKVKHGFIREVSLVMAGANPGAKIDNLALAHSAFGDEVDITEAFITTGLTLQHSLQASTSDEEDYMYHNDDDVEDYDFDDEFSDTDDDDDADDAAHSTAPQRRKQPKVKAKPNRRPPQNTGAGADDEETELAHAAGKTIRERYESLSAADKQLVLALVAQTAVPSGSGEASHSGIGGMEMKRNVFDSYGEGGLEGASMTGTISTQQRREILHSAIQTAKDTNGKLSDAVIQHAMDHGIENIELLFPEARLVDGQHPELVQREKGWVRGIMNGMRKVPFSNIKSMSADIREDEARAKGYITGKRKWPEVFSIMTRTTTPQTVYSKQALERDDIVDITDFDVVAWVRGIMRMMLNEEIARAVLIGDDRPVESKDRIKHEHIRPVWTDDDFYCHKLTYDANITALQLIDEIVIAGQYYEGNGEPTLYTTRAEYTNMQLVRDTTGRRIYTTRAELASALGVADIVDVPVMKNATRTNAAGERVGLIGLLLDISDYTMGANRGGEINAFDDFDIDYNQHKYLLETRVSGALTKWRTAVALERRIGTVG